jgi:hypothetical protein
VASNKVYDATTVATLSGSASVTPLGNDIVAVSSTQVGTFADKNVGTGKSVSIGALSLTGADAGNYTPVAPAALTANITPAALSLNGLSAATKVYDTTTTAALTGTPNVTPLPGDSVSLSGTPVGAFADKNVGTAKPVSVSNVGLSGTDGANYVLAAPTSLTANITPAPLLIDGYTAANKVYDGTTVATLLGTGSYEPIGSDNVVVVGQPVGTFSSKNVGTRSVTLGGLALGGADGGNYTAVTQSALAADITPAPLAITGVTANNKVYDATTAATLGGSAVAAAFGSDVRQRRRHAGGDLLEQERRHRQERRRRRLCAERRRRRQLHPGPAERPERRHHAGHPADQRRDRRQQGLRRQRRCDDQRHGRRRRARQRHRDGRRHTDGELLEQGRRYRQDRIDQRPQPGRCRRRELRRRQRCPGVDRRHHARHAALRRRAGRADGRARDPAADRHRQRLRGRRDGAERHHRHARLHHERQHRVAGRPVRDQRWRPCRPQLRLRAGRGQRDGADLEPERSPS